MPNSEDRKTTDGSPPPGSEWTFGAPGNDPAPKARERVLREALALWRADDLISADQYDLLLARVGGAPDDAAGETPRQTFARQSRLGRGVAILVNVGAVILAAGLIVFFASNWIGFSRPAKIASIFILTPFFYVVGFELTENHRVRFPALGVALIFLGCVMFGIDMILLGLIYDIPVQHAWSLLMDAAAWLSLAYLLRSRLILWLGMIGVIAWFGAEVGYLWGAYWIYLGRPFHFLGLGACFLAVSGLHARRHQRRFAAPYALAGLVLIYLSTLVLSIFDVQREFRAVEWQAPTAVWLMLVVPYILAVLAVAVFHFGWRHIRVTDPPVLVAGMLFGVLVFLTIVAWTPGPREGYFILLLTVLTASGVYLGIAWRNAVFLNTSLAFFVINAYTRFYEYFWGAMPKSLFFIIGGATLIAGGICVERLRRRLVRRFVGATA